MTERLSSWIEFQLQPLMTLLKFRLEDSSHFLRKLEPLNSIRREDHDAPNIIHCSWDIEAMYRNIGGCLGTWNLEMAVVALINTAGGAREAALKLGTRVCSPE